MEQGKNLMFPVENALEMILMFGRDGRISYGNLMAREKLGYEEELCTCHISDIFPGAFRKTEDGFETEILPGGALQKMTAYRRNSACFPVEARIVENGPGEAAYICMANDVLEKEFLNKEIEKVRQEAREALKVKSEFVANVTHELRTPVNGVLGNVRALLDGETDERTERQLRLIERCCGDMNKIINNILDFSKLEAGKFVLEPRRFHFRNMLDYVKSNHINKITEKGLEFFMTVSPQIPEYIVGDELRIIQILNNLLSNAQKFTTVGKITLEVFRTASVNDSVELFFIVRDTGIGIDEKDKEKLFQSFSQVDASISRKYGGTGLGLNISKQLVELMGGRIEVESVKNKGSTFSFSIWAGVSEEDGSALPQADDTRQALFMAAPGSGPDGEGAEQLENARKYGTPENRKNLRRNLSKLILCVEMENWEKAEMFMETVRQLTEEAPWDVKRVALRLKMAIQKENYDKAAVEFAKLTELVG